MVHRVAQSVTTSGTTSDNERQRLTNSNNESSFWLIFRFSEEKRYLTTKHSKESTLNLDSIGLDWNALFRVDKIVEKNQINKCVIQVVAHINRYI